MAVELPPGFVLQKKQPSALPPGFVLQKKQSGIDPTYGEGNIAKKIPLPPAEQQALNALVGASKGIRTLQRQGKDFVSELPPDQQQYYNNSFVDLDKVLPEDKSTGGAYEVVGNVLLDPTMWAVGSSINKALPYAPLLGKETINAVTGATKAAQGFSKNAVSGLLNLGKNAISGGLAGRSMSELSETDPNVGMGVGALANMTIPPALHYAGKGAGWVYDAVKGRLSKIRAGNVFRQAAGDKLPEAMAAYRAAPPSETAVQATAGLKHNTLDALGQVAKLSDPDSFYTTRLDDQMEDLLDPIRRLAGGSNQTEALKALDRSAGTVNQITTPMRDDVMDKIRQTHATVQKGATLQNEADALAEAASNKVQDVRRFTAAAPRAFETPMAKDFKPVAGMPRVSALHHPRANELFNMAEDFAAFSADDSLILGQGARFKQLQADSIAAEGLLPIDGQKIIAALESKIKNPNIGSQDLMEKTLTHVRDRFLKWTGSGGLVDPGATYGIRKSAVNDAIESLRGGSSPKAKAKAAAKILAEVKPLIDKAIINASNDPVGWTNYLNTFEEGMNEVSKMKMGAKALDLLTNNKGKFVSLVDGNDPKAVRKIFQDRYDIAEAMGEKMRPLRDAAEFIKREQGIDARSPWGGEGLRNIISENTPKFQFFNPLDQKIALVNKLLGTGETKVTRDMMVEIIKVGKSGKAALNILNELPTSERNKVVKAILDVQGNTANTLKTATTIGAIQGAK